MPELILKITITIRIEPVSPPLAKRSICSCKQERGMSEKGQPLHYFLYFRSIKSIERCVGSYPYS